MTLKKIPRTRQAIERFLKKETLGFLGLEKDGQPYVVPLTYAYHRGKILFHGALAGRKLDFMKSNPRVCFTVGVQSGPIVRHTYGAKCLSEHDSVICFGRVRLIDDIDERRRALGTFNRCLEKHPKAIPLKAAAQCFAAEISISRMSMRRKRKGNEWSEGECILFVTGS